METPLESIATIPMDSIVPQLLHTVMSAAEWKKLTAVTGARRSEELRAVDNALDVYDRACGLYNMLANEHGRAAASYEQSVRNTPLEDAASRNSFRVEREAVSSQFQVAHAELGGLNTAFGNWATRHPETRRDQGALQRLRNEIVNALTQGESVAEKLLSGSRQITGLENMVSQYQTQAALGQTAAMAHTIAQARAAAREMLGPPRTGIKFHPSSVFSLQDPTPTPADRHSLYTRPESERPLSPDSYSDIGQAQIVEAQPIVLVRESPVHLTIHPQQRGVGRGAAATTDAAVQPGRQQPRPQQREPREPRDIGGVRDEGVRSRSRSRSP
jgi:hypothetical protein